MKVIDLLNKIANGEELPEKIRFDNTDWDKVDGEKYEYYMDDLGNELFMYFFRRNLTFGLNDEVEIIEEDKKIEKLNLDYILDNDISKYFGNKINEIIDVINKGEE